MQLLEEVRPRGLEVFRLVGASGVSLFLFSAAFVPPAESSVYILLAMATSRILQHLYSLNTTSPDLLPNLYRLIQNDDKEQYLSGLQGADLIRLVDFLEEVRCLPYPLPS